VRQTLLDGAAGLPRQSYAAMRAAPAEAPALSGGVHP
jgi:hypothetical protein